jgi:hypothetical protein
MNLFAEANSAEPRGAAPYLLQGWSAAILCDHPCLVEMAVRRVNSPGDHHHTQHSADAAEYKSNDATGREA